MEPLQARVPEQRAPLRIGHVPDDRPVAVTARLRPLDALVLLDHPKANPQHPHERRDGHIEIAHVPVHLRVVDLAPRESLGARALGAAKGVQEAQDDKCQLDLEEGVQVDRIQDAANNVDRASPPRLRRDPREDLDAIHEDIPGADSHDRVRLVLRLHPSAHAPNIGLDRAPDQVGVRKHVQDEGDQLPSAVRVIGGDNVRPASHVRDRAPNLDRRLNLAPR